MALNLRSVMLCYKHAAIQMIKQGKGGRIVGPEPTSALASNELTSNLIRGFFHSGEERYALVRPLS